MIRSFCDTRRAVQCDLHICQIKCLAKVKHNDIHGDDNIVQNKIIERGGRKSRVYAYLTLVTAILTGRDVYSERNFC